MREHYHKFQWFYLTFLGLIFVGLAGYYLIHFGYYPVAVVNTEIISAKDLNYEFSLAYRYYSVVLGNKHGYDVESREFRRELRGAALENLIEKSLIYKEAKARIGRELERLVDNKINKEITNQQSVEEAAKLLYGMNLADFKELVLVPQARKEILEGRLFLEKKDFRNWLAQTKNSASVFILTPEFYWESGELKAGET